MDSRLRSVNLAALYWVSFVVVQVSKFAALGSTQDFNPPYTRAISEAIVKGLGFQADEFKISGFDLRDAQVGKSVAYEFDVEIDDKVLPFKLLEDVNRWEYVDLPIFQMGHPVKLGGDNGLVENTVPVLAPFQLAGPMELWIQDAKDMKISLPHDVDAGVLKKVILADGVVVTVKGARSVSLRHPLELPLPLNRTSNGFASGLLTLAEWLRSAAQSPGSPLLSLRIVGPTSLSAPAPSTLSSNIRLKLKRLASWNCPLLPKENHQKAASFQPLISKENPLHFLHPIVSAHFGPSHPWMVQTATCLASKHCSPLCWAPKQM